MSLIKPEIKGTRSCTAFDIMGKKINIILNEEESHWRVLGKGIASSDLYVLNARYRKAEE